MTRRLRGGQRPGTAEDLFRLLQWVGRLAEQGTYHERVGAGGCDEDVVEKQEAD